MELFLNSVWFTLVAAGLFALLQAYRKGLDRRRFLLALGALLCAAAILFPSISITDDLHLDAFVMEDSNSTKRLGNAVTHAVPLSKIAWLGFVALSFLLVSRQCSWCLAENISPSYKAPLLIRPVLGRAPPASFLA
jgi:hypothetical protein